MSAAEFGLGDPGGGVVHCLDVRARRLRRLRDAGQRDRGGELPARKPAERVGRHGRRRPDHPGLRHRHQRQPGRDRLVQGRARRPPPTGSTSTASATTAGNGARLVATVHDRVDLPQTNQPACLTERHRPRRLRQLVGLRLVGGARDRGLRHLHRAGSVRGRRHAGASHIVFVVRDDDGDSRPSSSRPPTPPGRPTTATAATASTRVGPGGGLSARGAPTRSATTGRSPRATTRPRTGSSTPSTRWSAGSSATATTSATPPASTRPARRRAPRSTGSSSRSATTSTGRRSSARTSRRPATPAVHLAFFSGNEVFWKTRWETSIDGPGTAYRTLVCYKETHAGAKIDPSLRVDGHLARPAVLARRPTAVARRTRSPARSSRSTASATTAFAGPGGGREDALLARHPERRQPRPPARSGRRRPARSATSGTRTSTTASGPRGSCACRRRPSTCPPGSCRTTGRSSRRAWPRTTWSSTSGPSGALVFGAGTVQWSWGLDGNHDRGGAAPSVDMQQATVNLFADMGVQPATLQGGLLPASASTDVVRARLRHHLPGGRRHRPGRHPGHHPGTATDGGARPGGRGRGLGGRRGRPGTPRSAARAGPTPGRRSPPARRHDPLPRRRRQRQPRDARAPGGRSSPSAAPAAVGPGEHLGGGGSPAVTNVNDGRTRSRSA